HTCTTNSAGTARRRTGRHQAVSMDQGREKLPDGDIHSRRETLQSREVAPAEATQLEDARERIRASVERLPDFLRQVLVLAYYQGLKYREIADMLGIPVGTVKSRLHAALTKLHEIWAASPSLYEA